MLTPFQITVLQSFINEVFDVRLRLALKDQTFSTTSPDQQRRRGQVWLSHYATMVTHTLGGTYTTLYPEVIRYIAKHSLYYYDHFQSRIDPRRHLCSDCIQKPVKISRGMCESIPHVCVIVETDELGAVNHCNGFRRIV